jgi:hypothetical protein
MAARIRLRLSQSRRKRLHQILVFALIAPLVQIIQIASPNVAFADAPPNPFTANFDNATPGTFVFPDGVTRISITLKGGADGKGGNDSRVGGNPGNVNVVTGNLTVTPGETLSYGVGGGIVTYEITGGSGVGTVTGNTLSASTAGTIAVVATKQGDSQFASVVSEPVTFTFTE